MSLVVGSFILLLITIASGQLPSDAHINAGACPCDLSKGICDVSCCCDVDCTANELRAFSCGTRASEDVKLESTCFKNLPLYRSNSPYAVRTRDGLVCIDHPEEINYSYYEQLVNEKIDTSASSRSISLYDSVSLPTGTPAELTQYQLGTSIFRYVSQSNITTYYSLPIKLFNSATCSGFQSITYLNNFASTCTQPVTEQTCSNALSSSIYTSGFDLVTNPTTLSSANPTAVRCTPSGSGSASSWSSATNSCTNALTNLNLIIYYSTANGIESCNTNISTSTSSAIVQQTFTVSFVLNGSSTSNTRRSGNPGYFQGAAILAGTESGSSITMSDLTIAQTGADGFCSTTPRTTVRFGENRQSVCLFGNSTSVTCPDISSPSNIFMPFDPATIRVAAFANASSSNSSVNWLRVTHCTSEVGSSAEAVCQQGSVASPSAGQCYNRLDIQIAYANIGSVGNPQPILGLIVLHYQRIMINTTTISAPLLLTQTVTFQDVSNMPVTEGDHLPRPNTRLPGDFFYAFFRNRAANVSSFSSFAYLLIFVLVSILTS